MTEARAHEVYERQMKRDQRHLASCSSPVKARESLATERSLIKSKSQVRAQKKLATPVTPMALLQETRQQRMRRGQREIVKKLREPVFDEKTRTNGLPRRNSSPTFEFLNNASGRPWQQERELIQEWMNHLPDDEDTYFDIRKRFRSGKDNQFNSAYLELYLHEALLRAGYSITIHPQIPGSSKHPDFLVTRGDTKFYLEAIVPAINAKTISLSNRRNVLLDAINDLSHDSFKLALLDVRGSTNNPSSKKFKAEIKNWLDTLCVDEIRRNKNYPHKLFSFDNWSLELEAWPKSPSDKSHRSIFMTFSSGVEKYSEDIYRALSKKNSKYGKFDAPYVIAVGIFTFGDADHFYITKALYETREKMGGFFGKPGEWKHQGLSGVLLVDQLSPHHFHSRTTTTLWLHPTANRPLIESIDIPLTVMRKTEEGFIEEPGVSGTEFFGLSEDWPEGNPFPDLPRE